MYDIENELKSLGAKKECADETLCQRTVGMLSKAQQKAIPRRTPVLGWASAAAVAVLAAILLFGVLPGARQTSYFTIDINPSIGIETDASGIILSVKAQNSDAEALLADLDLVGIPFTDALRCVVQAAEEQGYLTDNGHVLVAHFGATAQVTEEQIEAAVTVSTHRQISVLLLQGDRSDYEKASRAHQSAGISLLMESAEQCGIEDADIDTIIRKMKKNNDAANGNGSSHVQGSPSATAEASEPNEQSNGNPNRPEKTHSGNNGNNGGSNNNGNSNENNSSHGNNNGNNGQSGKEDKQRDNED